MAEEAEVAQVATETTEAETSPADALAAIEARAAEVDAELAAEDGKEKPEEQEPEAKPTPKQRTDAIQRFIDSNYGGDEEAFVQSLYASRTEMSRLATELKELKTGLAKSPELLEKEDQEAVSKHPDVSRVDKAMQSLSNSQQTLETRQSALVIQWNQLGETISNLKGQIERADDLDKAQLSARLAGAEASKQSIENAFFVNKTTLDNIEFNLSELQSRKDIALQQAMAERRQQRYQESESLRIQQQAGQDFSASVLEVVKEAGIDPDSDLHSAIFHSAKSQILDMTKSLKEGQEFDIPALTKEIASKIVSALNLSPSKRFQQASKEKAQTVTKPTRAVSTPVIRETPTSTSQKKDADYWLKRAMKITGQSVG